MTECWHPLKLFSPARIRFYPERRNFPGQMIDITINWPQMVNLALGCITPENSKWRMGAQIIEILVLNGVYSLKKRCNPNDHNIFSHFRKPNYSPERSYTDAWSFGVLGYIWNKRTIWYLEFHLHGSRAIDALLTMWTIGTIHTLPHSHPVSKLFFAFLRDGSPAFAYLCRFVWPSVSPRTMASCPPPCLFVSSIGNGFLPLMSSNWCMNYTTSWWY